MFHQVKVGFRCSGGTVVKNVVIVSSVGIATAREPSISFVFQFGEKLVALTSEIIQFARVNFFFLNIYM